MFRTGSTIPHGICKNSDFKVHTVITEEEHRVFKAECKRRGTTMNKQLAGYVRWCNAYAKAQGA